MGHSLLEADINIGLPSAFAQDISDLEIKPPLRWLYSWAFMLFLIAGFLVGGFFLWPTIDNINQQNAISAAEKLNGQSFDSAFGMSMVLALFIWIIAVALIIAVIILSLPNRHKASFYMHSRSDFIGSWPKFYGLHKIWTGDAQPTNGIEYIDAVCRKMRSITLKITTPMMILAIGLAGLEMSWFDVFTPTQYIQNPLFGNKLKTKNWSDASEVKLGCNFVEKRTGKRSSPAKNSIIYEVIWPDETSVRIRTEGQINSKSWLDNFETIDKTIRSGDAVFKRWNWLKRDPLHPICVSHFRTELGQENAQRFNRLLRIGELG